MTWPSAAEEANVDFNLVFTFYRAGLTNYREGRTDARAELWSLFSNSYYCAQCSPLNILPFSIVKFHTYRNRKIGSCSNIRKDFQVSSSFNSCEMRRITLGWHYNNTGETMEQKCDDFQSLVDWLETFNLNYKVGQSDIVLTEINLTGNKAWK